MLDLVFAILCGIFRGAREAMTMTLAKDVGSTGCDGVRCNKWFWAYKPADLLFMFCFALLMLRIGAYVPPVWSIPFWFVAVWEAYELTYAIVRHREFPPKYEYLTLIDRWTFRATGKTVWLIHGIRIAIISIYFGWLH